MQSLAEMFMYGLLLIVGLFAITSANELRKQRDLSSIQLPRGVTVEQVTEPVDHANGPHWDERSQKLYFVDVDGQRIYRLNTATGDLTNVHIANYGPVGLAVTVRDPPGYLVAGVGEDFVLIKWDGESNSTNSTIQILETIETDVNNTRFSGGKVDSQGHLWAGTQGPKDSSGVVLEKGAVYVLRTNFSVTKLSPVSISSGFAWSPSNDIFYYIDSANKEISVYDFYAEYAAAGHGRRIFNLPSKNIFGIPGGLTVDTDGNLWIALFDAGRVIKVDPVGERLLQSIEIPGVSQVTNVAFGGPLSDVLYVTTSRHGLTPAQLESQPKAGSVFAIKGLGVRGVPTNSYALDENRTYQKYVNIIHDSIRTRNN